MSIKRLGNVLPNTGDEHHSSDESAVPRGARTAEAFVPEGEAFIPEGEAFIPEGDADQDAEATAFVRFCYRRRAVPWPELYDEMCAVAARGEYRGMDYEQLQRLGIGFALSALPRLAALAARVIAEERGRPPAAAVA